MTKNDYIAEYVKSNHPHIINSVDFAMWKFYTQLKNLFTQDNRGDEDLEDILEQIAREEEESARDFESYADKHGYDRDYGDLFHFGLGRARQLVNRLVDGCK